MMKIEVYTLKEEEMKDLTYRLQENIYDTC